LPPAMVGISAPIDPGTHALRAMTKDGASVELQVKLAPGSHETAVLQLRAAEPPSVASAPAPAGATPPAPSGETVPPASGTGLGKVLGWIGVGVGIAGLAVGTTFVAINRTKRTDANALCSGGCPLADEPRIQSLDQQADDAATGAWIGYVAGGAVLVTGLVLLFTSGEAKKNDASSGLRPWVGPGAGGVAGEF
jgi:hypothetical protein